MDGGHHAGEIGGIVAGSIAVLAALGKAASWTFDRLVARIDKRAMANELEASYLKEYRQSLDRAAKDFRDDLEERVSALEVEVLGLRKITGVLAPAITDVTTELRRHEPTSPALARALTALKTLTPDLLELTPALAGLLKGLDAMGGSNGGTA